MWSVTLCDEEEVTLRMTHQHMKHVFLYSNDATELLFSLDPGRVQISLTQLIQPETLWPPRKTLLILDWYFIGICIVRNLAIRYVSWYRGNDTINILRYIFSLFSWSREVDDCLTDSSFKTAAPTKRHLLCCCFQARPLYLTGDETLMPHCSLLFYASALSLCLCVVASVRVFILFGFGRTWLNSDLSVGPDRCFLQMFCRPEESRPVFKIIVDKDWEDKTSLVGHWCGLWPLTSDPFVQCVSLKTWKLISTWPSPIFNTTAESFTLIPLPLSDRPITSSDLLWFKWKFSFHMSCIWLCCICSSLTSGRAPR